MISPLCPFHLAFPVTDLAKARAFYGELLGCTEGRSAEQWIDFNLYGHQIVAHLKTETESNRPPHVNPVDGHHVPIPHFGVVLDWDAWETLRDRLQEAGIEFAVEPHIRFRGRVGEQATLFFFDPFGNALEFKAFRDPAQLFAR
jgi:extradiol dioxygenase family protein